MPAWVTKLDPSQEELQGGIVSQKTTKQPRIIILNPTNQGDDRTPVFSLLWEVGSLQA